MWYLGEGERQRGTRALRNGQGRRGGGGPIWGAQPCTDLGQLILELSGTGGRLAGGVAVGDGALWLIEERCGL